jgi:hypothetical protein
VHRPTGDAVPDCVAVSVPSQECFVLALVDEHAAPTLGDHQAVRRLFRTTRHKQLLDHPSTKRLGLDAQGRIQDPPFLPGFEQLGRKTR